MARFPLTVPGVLMVCAMALTIACNHTVSFARDVPRIDSIRTDAVSHADPPDYVLKVLPIPFLVVDRPRTITQRSLPKRSPSRFIHPSRTTALVPSTGVVQEARVADWPFVNAGKLIVRNGYSDGYCTAQFLGSSTVLLTAAHCVRDGRTGDWYLDAASAAPLLKFYRAYKTGGWAQFVASRCIATSAQWPDGKSGDPAYDYAFIKTSDASTAGWFELKLATYSMWSGIGYPKSYGNLQLLNQVTGSLGAINAGEVEMLNNPMDDGASGGAWIGDLTAVPKSGNYVIGLNSNRSGNSMMSPFFGQDVLDVYAFVENDCK